MFHKSKTFVFALLAMLTMSVAAAAPADAVNFHSEQTNATLTSKAESDHIFDVAGLSIVCKEASFTGKAVASTESSITVSGGYGGCTFLFNIGVTVNMNTCDYVFHANQSVDIACATAGDEITFSGPGCTIRVPAQSGLRAALYSNIGNGTTREVVVTPAVTGVKYTESGFYCGTGTTNNGNYTTGATTVTGEISGAHVGVAVPADGDFHAEQVNVELTTKAEGHHVFDAAGLSITCKEANFSGTHSLSTQASITFSADYGSCDFIGASVSVDMKSCDYVFRDSGTVDIECANDADEITFSGPGCTVRVPEQTGLSNVKYTNIGSGTTQEVTVAPAVTDVRYTESGFLCGSGTTINGNYTTGVTTVTGEKAGVHVGVWSTG